MITPTRDAVQQPAGSSPRTKPSPEALSRAYAALRAWWATENGKAAIARVKARREAQDERSA